METSVTVVGAGIAGAACARELRRLGRPCRVVERGRAPGGRLASPTVRGRRVDLGAGYFTVRDTGFDEVVGGWADAGLARPWTDTFDVLSPTEEPRRSSGPVRWAASGGLRSLVRALLTDVTVELEHEVTMLPGGPVVLAMPDPQASRLLGAGGSSGVAGVEWLDVDPVIAVAAGFGERSWWCDAAFVNDDADLTFVADDGSRRGDGAPVLVAHTTPELARRHLAAPDAVVPLVSAALTRLLGTGTPEWTQAHRWTFAKPTSTHPTTHHWDGSLGLAGDQWCPDGPPRVESAWRSGVELARAIAG
ncbi:MAG: NAD(P)-binding protein [Lapillicoccus sp.]